MINKIHIFGASGSGTTTLGRALELKLGYKHFDTDNYFWLPTEPPYTHKREINERQETLRKELQSTDRWVLTGSLCGWGDIFIPMFDLAVYLWIPKEIRMERLDARERQRYGDDSIKAGGIRYDAHKVFVNWASQYDDGDMSIRSRLLHDKWMEYLSCPVLRLEGDLTVEERVGLVVDRIKGSEIGGKI